MSRLLIRNVDVLTLDAGDRVVKNTTIAVDGKTIAAVGQAPRGFQPDETIEGQNHVALPGFFNAHTHAAMALQRGWAEDLPLDRWFNERIWVAESALTEEDVYWGAQLAACEMIRSGTVAFADHYFWMSQVARVVEESGLKALLAWCVFGLGAEQEIGGTTLELTERFVQRWQGAADGRIRTILGPHSPYICKPAFLERAAASAKKLGCGLHLHVAESQGQVDQSLKEYGKTPVAQLAALGLLDAPTLAAHCIYLSKEDVAILAEKQVNVVQCPKTHLKLAMGTTPVPELIGQGVNVALGTDGPASNNDMDMFEVTRLAALVQKAVCHNPELLPSMQALKLATTNGARAMGFENSGVLAPGRTADLILVNMDRPHLRPRHHLAANIVYGAHAGDVDYSIVDGRVLMRKGELTTLDEDKILAEAEKRAVRLVGQEMKMVREYKS